MAPQTLIGFLLDVSGSMKENAVGSAEDEGEWIRSLFQVIDDVVKNDVHENNKVFTIGVGGQSKDGTFDILKSVSKAQTLKKKLETEKVDAQSSTVNSIFSILKRAGANYIDYWVTEEDARKHMSQAEAEWLLDEIKGNDSLSERLVDECLPKQCKGLTPIPIPILGGLVNWTTTTAVSQFKQATPEDIRSAIESGIKLIILCPVSIGNAIEVVQDAAKIIRGTVKEKEITTQRKQELLDLVKPVIYGLTPIRSALKSAYEIFKRETSDVEKVMLVVSDGEWNERIPYDRWFDGVTIVSCFVSRHSNIRPRHLFDSADASWEPGAKKLFQMSSVVSSQLLPRSMIIQSGWSFDIENNQTKLFAHVNNPEHMREICRLGKNIVCNQECLSDLLVTVSLDDYINQNNKRLTAREQVGATCYANAAAVAIHLSLKRILGRDGDYPDFETLREELIEAHGQHGANTFQVLETICPHYRLRCSEINVHEVFRAIVAKRIVVARFRLTDTEWDVFDYFYSSQPKGILTRQVLDTSQRSNAELTRGHAVVVTSYTNNFLVLMNSRGDAWADKGFFRVENKDVLGLEFMDVFWTEADLTESERKYYKSHGSEVAQYLMSKLRGLQEQKYTCPCCRCTSNIQRFTGTLTNAKCPECNQMFDCSEAGNILAMNIYLTSIATSTTA